MNLKHLSFRLSQMLLMLGYASQGVCSYQALSLIDFQSNWSGSVQETYVEQEAYTRLTTNPQEGPSLFVASSGNPISFSKKFLQTKIRINSLKAVSGIELRLSSDATSTFTNFLAVRIPFYTDAEFNLLQDDEWANISLSLGAARVVGSPNIEQIKHVAFYIEGKADSTTPLIVDFQNISIKTPVTSAILSMTFDDGYDDHYETAKIMAEYGLRGTAYIMANEIDEESYLTTEQMLSLNDDYHWSISSHHFTPITSPEMDLNSEVNNIYRFFNQHGLANTAGHFAYPLGKQSRKNTLPFIREFFKSARVAGGGAETLPPADWHMLKTYNITPDKTPEEIARRIEKAKEHNEWLILMFHLFTEDEPTNELTYKYENFEELCRLISESGIRVHPVDEVYEALEWK